MIESRQIEAFRAAALHGSFTQGAEALGITQPSLTRAVARLEHAVGFPLFLRGHGAAQLTPEGKAFLDEVERSFVGLQQLHRAAQDIRNFGTGRLRVACLHVLSNGVAPAAIATFLKQFSETTISLQTRSSQTIYEWVASRRCDLGVAGPKEGFPDVEEVPFLSATGCIAMPQGHKLSRLKRPIVPADLSGKPLLALALEDVTRHRFDAALAKAGVSSRIQIETPYASTLYALVAEGLGVALVNPVAAVEHRHLPIVLRPFEPKVLFESRLLWPKGQPKSSLAIAFADMMQAEAMRRIQQTNFRGKALRQH